MTSAYREQPIPIIVLAFGGRLIGMHADSGERVWENRLSGSNVIRVVVAEGRVLALAFDTLACFDYQSGSRVWEVQVDRALAGPATTVLAHDGKVVCASAGEAAAYRIADGKVLWHDEFKGYGVYDVAIAVPGASAQVDRRGS